MTPYTPGISCRQASPRCGHKWASTWVCQGQILSKLTVGFGRSGWTQQKTQSLGIQSPKLRMVSWNLNTLRFVSVMKDTPIIIWQQGDWILRCCFFYVLSTPGWFRGSMPYIYINIYIYMYTHRIHVWHTCLDLAKLYGKCRQIYHACISWDRYKLYRYNLMLTAPFCK